MAVWSHQARAGTHCTYVRFQRENCVLLPLPPALACCAHHACLLFCSLCCAVARHCFCVLYGPAGICTAPSGRRSSHTVVTLYHFHCHRGACRPRSVASKAATNSTIRETPGTLADSLTGGTACAAPMQSTKRGGLQGRHR